MWLIAATIVTRTIGIFFRVYMADIIGSEALGLYQLIVTAYMLAVTVVTAGLSLAVTRLIIEERAKGKNNATAVTVRCVFIGLVISAVSSLVLYFGADYIGSTVFGDVRTILAIKILAPSIPFMAVSSCIRGYFYAKRYVLPTAGEQLLEQITEIGVFIVIINVIAPVNVENACCAVAAGTTAAEVVSCVYSYVCYRISSKKEKCDTVTAFYRRTTSIAIPVMLSSGLRSGLSMAENSLIPKGLAEYGSSYMASLSCFGIITGMAMPVLVFPSVILISLSLLIIPEISEVKAKNNKTAVYGIVCKMLNLSLMFSIPTALIFLFFAKPLGNCIYGNLSSGAYIAVLAPLVPLWYTDKIVDGMLKGLNEQVHYLAYNIIDSALRVLLIAVLVPRCGVYGIIIMLYVSAILNTGLSLYRLLKVTQVNIKVISWIILPLCCGVVPCVAVVNLFRLNSPFMLVMEIVIVVVAYIVLTTVINKIIGDKKQVYLLRFGKAKTCHEVLPVNCQSNQKK